MPEVRKDKDATHAGTAVAAALMAALDRQGFGRADDYGGVGAGGHLSSEGEVWLSLWGRMSGRSAARLTEILNAAEVGESDMLRAWLAGEKANMLDGTPVPAKGTVVLDHTQIERPGRVVDWDGAELLTLCPPVGGDEWSVAVRDVRPVGADVDTRLLER